MWENSTEVWLYSSVNWWPAQGWGSIRIRTRKGTHWNNGERRTGSFSKYQLVPSSIGTRRVWRYQRGNQNPYIEEEQTTQWPKEKVQKDKQRSTKYTHKTKDRVKQVQFCILSFQCYFTTLCFLSIVLSVLWFMASDYSFGIFKLFLCKDIKTYNINLGRNIYCINYSCEFNYYFINYLLIR